MALHSDERRWFALMIGAINALSARVDVLDQGVGRGSTPISTPVSAPAPRCVWRTAIHRMRRDIAARKVRNG